MLLKKPNFTIYFGDASDDLYPTWYLAQSDLPSIIDVSPFDTMQQSMNLQSLLFLRQVHGIDGAVVRDNNPQSSFAREGDFLITNCVGAGIGLMTADCLPLVYYDHINHAAAVVHAGWQGSVRGVATIALARMADEYGTHPADVQVFFGPSAQRCCYAVSDNFATNLMPSGFVEQVLQRREGQLYFDLPQFNRLQLDAAGVRPDAISTAYNLCTICDHRFFSHRREKERAGRQVTIVGVFD